MQSSRILNASKLCLVMLALFLPVAGYWATQLKFGTTFVEKWLPGDDEARSAYREFRERFGDDQFLIVSWPECSIEDPRLAKVAARLQTLMASRPELAIESIQDSASLINELTDGPASLERSEAIRRLSGFAIGRAGHCFLTLKVAQASVESRAELISTVREAAFDAAGIDQDELILAGEPFQIHMIDRSSREAMQYLVLPSTLLALVIAWCCLRRMRLTLLVFALAGVGQVIGMAAVSFFLGEMIAVLVVLPTLVFMLTLSAAVHLSNYFLDSGGESEPMAGVQALRIGAAPCILATLTTVFGFGSLFASQLAPVWHFGTLAALSLVLSSAITLSVFPAAVRLASRKNLGPLEVARRTKTDTPSQPCESTIAGVHTPTVSDNRLAAWTNQFATPITVGGIALLIFALVGLRQLRTSTEYDDMFPERSESIQSLRWVQQNLGPINSLEFLVHFPREQSDAEPNLDAKAAQSPSDILERLALVDRLQQTLAVSPSVDSTVSAMTFLPPLPNARGTRGAIRRAVFRKKVIANKSELESSGLLYLGDEEEIWRITARVKNLRGDNYAVVRDQLVAALQADIGVYSDTHSSARPTLQLTGLRTIVEKAHYALITDLATSFAAAFILITPVMMLIVRGVVSGLILMIPNVLPVALVFGCMGWLGIKVDVASILTASVALGIAVDDTLHFVTWFFRSRRAGCSPAESARLAISACARPMFHTTIICTGAMLPFFFSQFLPTSKFALLMILILAGAILGDLVLLPAVLQSPLGRLVVGKDVEAREDAGISRV